MQVAALHRGEGCLKDFAARSADSSPQPLRAASPRTTPPPSAPSSPSRQSNSCDIIRPPGSPAAASTTGATRTEPHLVRPPTPRLNRPQPPAAAPAPSPSPEVVPPLQALLQTSFTPEPATPRDQQNLRESWRMSLRRSMQRCEALVEPTDSAPGDEYPPPAVIGPVQVIAPPAGMQLLSDTDEYASTTTAPAPPTPERQSSPTSSLLSNRNTEEEEEQTALPPRMAAVEPAPRLVAESKKDGEMAKEPSNMIVGKAMAPVPAPPPSKKTTPTSTFPLRSSKRMSVAFTDPSDGQMKANNEASGPPLPLQAIPVTRETSNAVKFEVSRNSTLRDSTLRTSKQRDTAAARAVKTAAEFGLRVCGVDVANLLRLQMANEAETLRSVAAYESLERSISTLNPSTLGLILKLKQPPHLLMRVLEAAVILLETPPRANGTYSSAPTPTVQLDVGSASPRYVWQTLDPTDMYAHMSSLDIDAVTPNQLSRLAAYLAEVAYDEVRKAFGIAACLWAWVCAVCVICGAPLAVLPSEDPEVIRCQRAARAAIHIAASGSSSRRLSIVQARTRNGRPITGRPSYSSTLAIDRASKQMKLGATAPAADISMVRMVEPVKWPKAAKFKLSELTPLKFLGAGAFANVFMCRHGDGGGELIALKCILKSLVLKKNKQRQLLAEKSALSCAPHPNIIRLYAAYADAQHLYFAMELALGGELFALIEEMDMLPEAATKYYAASTTLALSHLHGAGFIYRDLKPENLLLDVSGRLKVCDLGLAKQAERTWTLVGTPQYLSPELLRGEGATKASDWWALGVLIFEMATGDLPFTSPDGTDAGLFTLVKKGAYTWERPPRADRDRKKQGVDAHSISMRDLVGGLLRLRPGNMPGPPPPENKPVPPAASANGRHTAVDESNNSLKGWAGSPSPWGVSSEEPQLFETKDSTVLLSAPPAKPTFTQQRITKRAPQERHSSLTPPRIGSGGASEVKNHLWFRGLDFDALLTGAIPAPYVPNLRGKEDDANFGPIDWRGEPVITSPEYDVNEWKALWEEGDW